MNENMIQQQTQTLTAEVRLAALERKIEIHLASAYGEIVEVGRCLLAAKEEKLVPHGEWTDWVSRVCGMTERQAQRWMQIAREVPEGSVLASLPVSKIRTVLALPEDQREPMAQRVIDEGLTARQIEDAVREIKEQAEREKAGMQTALNAANAEAARVRRQLLDAQHKTENAQTGAAYENKIIEMQRQHDQDVADLRRELAESQAFADDQAAKRRDAQRKLLEMQSAESSGVAAVNAFDLAATVRTFIGAAGVFSTMAGDVARMDRRERRDLERYVQMVADWVDSARCVLSAEGVFADV